MKYLARVASLELVSDRCTGCGLCTEVCPHGVFAVEGKKAVVLDRDSCMECGACANNCAFSAITVAKGVGCAAALINSMVYGGEPSCDCSSTKPGPGGCC